ncbi:MAG TPA: protein phosphatase CheZ [Burkholderiaceae bacterium]|nr:protein phosphatase CheZ [Burkholderiaceae bacterium]
MTNSDPTAAHDSHDVYHRLGALTRTLHDALRQLGYDKNLEAAASSLPDARTRLQYISKLTGDAAEKVLNAVDHASVEQARIAAESLAVERDLKANPALAVASGRLLSFIEDVRRSSERTSGNLTEIMLAQDFHDLTGQVIARIVVLAQDMETQLVKLLIDAAPDRRPPVAREGAAPAQGYLNGPAMNAERRPDVVQNQAQVDDLLESLGF